MKLKFAKFAANVGEVAGHFADIFFTISLLRPPDFESMGPLETKKSCPEGRPCFHGICFL